MEVEHVEALMHRLEEVDELLKIQKPWKLNEGSMQ